MLIIRNKYLDENDIPMKNTSSIKKDSLSWSELNYLHNQLMQHGKKSIFEIQGLICAMLSSPSQWPITLWFPSLWQKAYGLKNFKAIEKHIPDFERMWVQMELDLLGSNRFVPLMTLEKEAIFDSTIFSETDWQHLQSWCRGYISAVLGCADEWADNREMVPLPVMPIALLAAEFEEYSKLTGEISPPKGGELNVRTICANQLPVLISKIYAFWRDKGNRLKRMDSCVQSKRLTLKDCWLE